MAEPLRFCLVLHNHQPIGNFDQVMEDAYQDSYKPFLDVFERYRDLKIALHTSGSLLEWLDEHHRDYVDRLARLVDQGRVEIVGGAFYEPILTMLTREDRVGQITAYSRWLQQRLGAQIHGMWVPERVWEPSLTRDLAEAGIAYTVLDDFHFKTAGLREDQIHHGYFVTEDEGRVLAVLPGSERLRYLIPFGAPHETIEHLRGIHAEHPGAVVVFGDDGEKFGTWPGTKEHVYRRGWLTAFFDALAANRDWLAVTTPAEAMRAAAPVGKVYLPNASYREMTEWALPVDRQIELEDLRHDFQHDHRWGRLASFIRGGFWRNFKVKYPESNEMYARMMAVSRRLKQIEATAADRELVETARMELYRGQCNCSYWHGAFGGIYLPHLRNAVYRNLIAADNLLDQAEGRPASYIEAEAADFNFDTRQEIRVTTGRLVAWVAPAAGGQLYELDVRSIRHNLLATLTRRPEAYHRKVLGGANPQHGEVASIHDRVVFKQEGLDQLLQYDQHPRKSLIDHFYDNQTSLDSVARGEAAERGDFALAPYEARLRRNPDRIQVQMTRQGTAFDLPLRITKGLTLSEESGTLEIAYLLEGLPADRTLHFGVELNFAGMPAGADDRYFYRGEDVRLGQLGSRLDLADVADLGLVDEWLGIDLKLTANRPTRFWTYPVETVSQSEAGFELVHQSVVVQPHWFVTGDAEGRWSVVMELAVDTSLAESRRENGALAGVLEF